MSKFYISGRNQTKTVTPSNIQQTVSPDTGYNALDAVVVNPIKAAMPQTLEQFIMRDNNMEPFSLSLDGDIPDYACYQQKQLISVYGNITSIGERAFTECVRLEEIDCSRAIKILQFALNNCSNLSTIDCRNVATLGASAISYCNLLKAVDCRNINSIGWYTFQADDQLHLLDITNTHSATLASSNSIPSNALNLTILVADATDKAYYQSATNWSAFASKIKTVAEYEQQIGMSYDDYYEIIFGHPRFDNAAQVNT